MGEAVAGSDSTGTEEASATGEPPAGLRGAAERLFGARLPVAVRYARLLATEGILRGLLGPREAPRLWDRHLLNCAALAERVPAGARVTDVGSGAGLPGIVLGVARPDLAVILVESLERRTTFLAEVVRELELDRVEVVRGRAEDLVGELPPADVVTARALAPLDRLVAWCLPLAAVNGRILAVKGVSAPDEIARCRTAVRRAGGGEPELVRCGVGVLEPPTIAVQIGRENGPHRRPRKRR